MKRRTKDSSTATIMIGVNTCLFAIGAMLVGYNTYFGQATESAARISVFAGMSVNDAMLISSFAIMLAGFFYSLAILKPDMLQRNRECKVDTFQAEASNKPEYHDRNTGLGNLDYITMVADKYLEEHNALDQTLGILVVSLGCSADYHAPAMRSAALALSSTARSTDVVARVGPKQIAVLTPEIATEDLIIIANRYRHVLDHAKDMPLMVSFTIGHASNSNKELDGEAILQLAEQNLKVNSRLVMPHLSVVA